MWVRNIWRGRASPIAWDHATDPSDVVFNQFLPAVGAMRALDPVTSELVRLRGAAQHNCRLCKSVRESRALDAGGSETLYADIEQFEESKLLDDRAKAALRYADALIWTPAHLDADVVAEVRSRFSEVEAVELTFDIMRNASNKIAVSLGGDAPRVESGTETLPARRRRSDGLQLSDISALAAVTGDNHEALDRRRTGCRADDRRADRLGAAGQRRLPVRRTRCQQVRWTRPA